MRVAAARVLVAVLAVTGPVALAGCAADASAPGAASTSPAPADLDADPLFAAARAALGGQAGWRVRGATAQGPLDLAFTQGQGAAGTVGSDGVPVSLVAVDRRIYVKGDPAYVASLGPAAPALVGTKWLLLPPGDTDRFSVFASGTLFADTLLDAQGDPVKGGRASVDGVDAVALSFPASGATLWVRAEGPPLPVRFERSGADPAGAGTLRFVDRGLATPIVAPPPADVVDVATLPAPSPAPAPAAQPAPTPTPTPRG